MFETLPARRAAGVLLAAAMALTACTSAADDADDSGDPAPAASETSSSASPSPTPSPTPTVPAVVGKRVTDWQNMPSRIILGQGSNPKPDGPAVRRSIDQVARWLDAHLTELHRDGSGLWGQMAVDGLANPQERELVTTGLASPDNPVTDARYAITVYYDGRPEFLSVEVAVAHPTGPLTRASLGFVVAEDGTPRLTMFGPSERGDA